MTELCPEHLNVPLNGCNTCWNIEKKRRGKILCKFTVCTSGSCKFRHKPYKHQPAVVCGSNSHCEVPWCGYIHPSYTCGHIRPTINCDDCEKRSLENENLAQQKPCDGKCKFDTDKNCYYSHVTETGNDSESDKSY